MWLKMDYIGPSSRIVYGKQGDRVLVIRRDSDLSLVENNGQKFFVRNERLSTEKVDPAPETPQESARSVQRARSRKRR